MKNNILRTLAYIWTILIMVLLLLVLVDAGKELFFGGWSIINFFAFGNGAVAKIMYGIATMFGLVGLINLFIVQLMMIKKKL